MFCGNCYTMCTALPLSDKEGDGVAIMAGGKVSNRIQRTQVLQGGRALPAERPRRVGRRRPQVIKKIVEAYAKDAKKYERIGDWAERIGWERFFEKCDIPFTEHLIDDYRLAYYTWRTSPPSSSSKASGLKWGHPCGAPFTLRKRGTPWSTRKPKPK